jgi:hypothetical protein
MVRSLGEASRRKANDPFYGRMPKGGKGIVISAPITIEPDGSISARSEIDERELRRAVLFWDRIVFPSKNIIEFSEGPEIEYLMKAGILKRPKAQSTNSLGSAGHLFAEAHINAFLKLEALEPGAWSMSEGPSSFMLNQTSFTEGRGALAELYRAIPVPEKDVPLEDLLNFKLARRDEIVSLSLEIDSLFSRVSSSNDSVFELNRAVRKIDLRCADMIRVSRESHLKFTLSDLKVSFSAEIDSGNLIQNGVIGALAGLQFGMPISGAMVGGITSSLRVKVGMGATLERRKHNHTALNPYRFVWSLHKEAI